MEWDGEVSQPISFPNFGLHLGVQLRECLAEVTYCSGKLRALSLSKTGSVSKQTSLHNNYTLKYYRLLNCVIAQVSLCWPMVIFVAIFVFCSGGVALRACQSDVGSFLNVQPTFITFANCS